MSKELPQQTTSKRVKFEGIQEYINASTGEVIQMAVTDIEERDFNFSKVWMRNFISSLDLIGNKKTRLAFWIIDNLNKENQLIYSYRQIAEQTGMSLDTVSTTMKTLKEADFLRQIGQIYTVNPDIIFKGTRTARLGVLEQYHSEPIQPPTKQEKIESLKNSISQLTQELRKLQGTDVALDLDVDPQPVLKPGKDGTLETVEVAKPAKKPRKSRTKNTIPKDPESISGQMKIVSTDMSTATEE